jgi:hypothetical protein
MAGTSTSHLSQAGCSTADNTLSYTGDGTSGIYIFGAQLSDSASVDPYVYQPAAAPSSTAYYGPRFDYDPVTLAPKGLLIEEQRTNLLTYSEQFDNAVWVKSNATVTANMAVAPNGTTTADKLVENTAADNHGVISSSVTVSLAPHTFSVFAKQGERSWLAVALRNGFEGLGANYTFFNLANGTIGNIRSGYTASISDVGNGFYRCSITGTTTATSISIFTLASTGDGTTSYTGDGTSGIFIWGAQLEAGAFATSYIPTAASQVTRAADSASMIGNNFARWYNQTEGTLFADFVGNATSFSATRFVLDASNILSIGYNPSYRGGAGALITASGTNASNQPSRVAVAGNSSGYALSYNGVAPLTSSTPMLTTATALAIGANAAGSATSNISGTISRIAYYGRRLANTELQGITS